MNKLTEILDTPVTPRKALEEAGKVMAATVVGVLKGFDQLSRKKDGDNRDFGVRAAEAALIPMTALFNSGRDSLFRLFSKPDSDKK